MFAEDIILKPVLTEKGYDGIADKKYTFIVKKSANKIEIRNAVEKLFGVKVAEVNTLNCKGKLKRMGRNEGYTPDRKKAIVTLKEDSKPIEFFNSLA
ncbi:MAG: 50S ribosomal protein L23 [Clostridiales bacterium]|nr:50S ribosomal protein L23 [Clostridiales bacterium]MDY4894285.1 50S ribosomal protein L23 [Christensenellaceae bacterium]HAC11446.1 50S ribosomal protein L23 [Clostridiales bacterium]